MPSSLHEVLIEMFRQRPSLAADLLIGALGLELPSYERAEIESADSTFSPRRSTGPMRW